MVAPNSRPIWLYAAVMAAWASGWSRRAQVMYRTVAAPAARMARSNRRTVSCIRAAFLTGRVLCSWSRTSSYTEWTLPVTRTAFPLYLAWALIRAGHHDDFAGPVQV